MPRKIELSNGRHMVQYRGHLMPLVRIERDVRIKAEGAQPLLVFSDGGRSMALVVDEIVDIVEERLDIEVGERASGRPRLGGDQGPGDRDHRRRPFPAAGVRGLVPPQGAARPRSAPRRVLLVDDSPFFRNMLTPVLKAAGYRGHRGRLGDGSARDDRGGRAFRRGDHRYRYAGDGRLRIRRSGARRIRAPPDVPMIALSSRDVGRSDRARPSGRLPRLRRQIRPPGPDRGAQGADR